MGRTGVQLGFTAVGTAVGAYFGAPMLGAQIGSVVGGIAAALIFPPEDQQGPRLGDLRIADASYGVPIPIVYGTARVAGVLIWTSGIQERATDQSTKGGGPTVTTYAYFSSFAVALCEGPIAAVRKIWLDTRLVFDVSQNNLTLVSSRLGALDPRGIMDKDELGDRRDELTAEITTAQSALAMYHGTEDQLPDPTMEAHEGAGQVPAHRGMAYLVFQDLPLEGYGNRIPNITAEVMTEEAPAYPRRSTTPAPFVLQKDNTVYDAPRQKLWHEFKGTVTEVDAMGNEVLRTGTLHFTAWNVDRPQGLGQYMGLDQDGALYLPTNRRGVGGGGCLVRVDPVSLAITHINVNGLTLENEYLFAMSAAFPSAHYVWAPSFGSAHELYCFIRPGTIDPHSGEPARWMARVGLYRISSAGGQRANWLCTDRDERAWAVCSGAIAAFDPRTFLLVMDPTGSGEMIDISADLHIGDYIAYDAATHSVIVSGRVPVVGTLSGTPRLIRFDCDTREVTNIADGFLASSGYVGTAWRRGIIGRQLWFTSWQRIHTVDVDSLSVVRDVATTLYPGSQNGYGGIYDPETHALWRVEDGVGFAKYYFDRTEPGAVTLGSIIQNLSVRAGLQGTDVVTGALTDPVHGYVVSQRSEARASVEALLGAFLADGVESDWQVRYMHRALAPVATLTEHDVAAHEPPASELPDPLTPERLEDQSLPIRVDVTYADPARDYQDTTQHAKRFQQGQRARSQREVRTPVVLTADQAKQLAEQSLAEAWVSRTTYALSLPYRWTTLDPGDVLTVTLGGRDTVLRLSEINQGANGILECRAVAYDRAIYTASPSLGVVGEGTPPQTIPWIPPTLLMLIDTHLMRDIDEGAGFYVGVAPQGSSGEWPGAVVFSSPDGTAWRQDDTITVAVDYGSAATVLAVGSPYVIDYGHTVDITMARGELTSITEAELLNGYNGGLLGQEILQWQTATPVGATTWRLSNLLRGRRGTEWAMTGHTAGERFLVLNPNTMRRKESGLSEVDQTRYYRAVTLNTDLLASGGQAFKNTALGLKCYSPEHVRGTRNAANTLTLTWARRTRLGGLWVDLRDVVLGETAEAYEVDITVAGVVTRTITSATQSATYTAAEQSADGITPGSSVTATVYQLGQLGRGWGTTATV